MECAGFGVAAEEVPSGPLKSGTRMKGARPLGSAMGTMMGWLRRGAEKFAEGRV